MSERRALMWFRRDLRLTDNAALSRALAENEIVFCLFVFDRDILDRLESKSDRRVEFIWQSVSALRDAITRTGGNLHIAYASAKQSVPAIAQELGVRNVYAARDYEPDAVDRDTKVADLLAATCGASLTLVKDHVIFERDEVLTQAQGTFSVFTPYKNAWLKRLTPADFVEHTSPRDGGHFSTRLLPRYAAIPTLDAMGFCRTNLSELKVNGGETAARGLLEDFLPRMPKYDEARNFPAVKGPSYLSVHLRFGTISIRECVRLAFAQSQKNAGAATWLSELIWRDFYFQILHHHPRVVRAAFKPQYDAIRWKNDEALFNRWKEGATGFPIVDAAMRQLNQTGYMHNRLRMIVASFLTKDLHIDWRWGERYFADTLLDFDLAANSGGWQWAASTGCDAQPYFRIFNPKSQSAKFDPEGKFIRRYVPELSSLPTKWLHAPQETPAAILRASKIVFGDTYPNPCVDHAEAREATLAMYQAVRE